MKFSYPYCLLLIALVFNVFILMIDSPLWDDWTLEGLTFHNIAVQFKGNGLYYGGLAHLHYFINVIDGKEVWFSRLLSLVCLISAPLLLFFILSELSFAQNEAFQISILALAIPLFGSAFGQIVLPYLICLNLFLLGILLLIKFLRNESNSFFLLIAASPLLFLSFITNSLIFFSLAVVCIILTYQFFDIGKVKKIIFVAGWLIGLIALFFVFKGKFLLPQGESTYGQTGYNSFGIIDLVYQGPLRTLKYMIDYPVIFLKETLKIFTSSFNVFLFLFLSILTAAVFYMARGIDLLHKMSPSKIYISFAVGLLLLVSAIYPYSVVGKASDSLFSYNERHNLLMPIGLSLILFSLIHSLLKPVYIKYAFALIIPFLFVLKLNIFSYFAVKADLQEQIGSEVKSYITHHKISGQSILFVNQTDDSSNLDDWSFYEYGGIMRLLNLPENKVFVSNSFLNENELGEPTLDIKGNTHLFIESPNYGISKFDTSNFQVLKYKLDIEDESNSYIIQALFDTLNVKFEVINQ